MVAIIGAGIYFSVYTKYDHWSGTENLSEDATVVGMDTASYNKYNMKTTVKFSDGFEYISFKTTSQTTGLMTYRIMVTPEIKKEILEKAISKHKELMQGKKEA